MSTPIIYNLLESFPKQNKSAWQQAAAAEIEGNDPIQALAWKSENELIFFPYYDKVDFDAHSYLKKFQLSSGTDPYAQARHWSNLPKVAVTNAVTANEIALQHLGQGADGILIDINEQQEIDFDTLLEKIDWPYCNISFSFTKENATALAAFIRKKNYPAHSLTGTLFWKDIPENGNTILHEFQSQQKICTLGLFISAASAIDEISTALMRGVKVIEQLVQHGIDPERAIKPIAFSLAADNDFLLTIAKLKALRMLWFQVAQAYGVKNYSPQQLHLHARSEPWIDQTFQPRGNMLKSTTASLACIMGGCDALTTYAEDEYNTMMNRIARNVSNILREESYLDKVADPTAGSYAIECIIDQLAREAWHKFQLLATGNT